ncbi:hypothetical protein BKA62DRAFT_282155 [Auriculariales sp. MPI-PUGE-AT-0066]|nr:hypothetical protein BKA62DRAFT_282155 [Auriculariales sp. MPI-PUGE-AT-0066]
MTHSRAPSAGHVPEPFARPGHYLAKRNAKASCAFVKPGPSRTEQSRSRTTSTPSCSTASPTPASTSAVASLLQVRRRPTIAADPLVVVTPVLAASVAHSSSRYAAPSSARSLPSLSVHDEPTHTSPYRSKRSSQSRSTPFLPPSSPKVVYGHRLSDSVSERSPRRSSFYMPDCTYSISDLSDDDTPISTMPSFASQRQSDYFYFPDPPSPISPISTRSSPLSFVFSDCSSSSSFSFDSACPKLVHRKPVKSAGDDSLQPPPRSLHQSAAPVSKHSKRGSQDVPFSGAGGHNEHSYDPKNGLHLWMLDVAAKQPHGSPRSVSFPEEYQRDSPTIGKLSLKGYALDLDDEDDQNDYQLERPVSMIRTDLVENPQIEWMLDGRPRPAVIQRAKALEDMDPEADLVFDRYSKDMQDATSTQAGSLNDIRPVASHLASPTTSHFTCPSTRLIASSTASLAISPTATTFAGQLSTEDAPSVTASWLKEKTSRTGLGRLFGGSSKRGSVLCERTICAANEWAEELIDVEPSSAFQPPAITTAEAWRVEVLHPLGPAALSINVYAMNDILRQL